MKGSFYEVLGLDPDVSPEDIRKAYRKRALQTHPDRLPPGSTDEAKRDAEEQFRKVNNAYEILMDKKNRKLYDLYGVWPPPDEYPDEQKRENNYRPGPSRTHYPQDPFNFPFMSPWGDPFPHHYRPRPTPAFRDPFELFNTMFGDEMLRGHPPFVSHPPDPFWGHPDPMLARPSDFFRPSIFPPLFHNVFDPPAFPDERLIPSMPPQGGQFAFQSASHDFYSPSGSDGPQWVSEQRMVRTVNGVTQSVWKRRDRHGNEHVTYTYPDGREKYMLNGVEQPQSTHHIDNGPSGSRYDTTQPVIPHEQAEAPSKKRWWSRN